jgi:carboxynorspermidine decarboxylase
VSDQQGVASCQGTPVKVTPSTPAIVFEIDRLEANFACIQKLAAAAGVTALYALKASYSILPFLKGRGVTGEVSSLFEAQLAYQLLGCKSHGFFVSITDEEWPELLGLLSHVSFNSLSQGERFAAAALEAGVACGLRVNPRTSVSTYSDYDPCEKGGRFGVPISELPQKLPEWVSGLHVHALCENGAEELGLVLKALEEQAAPQLAQAHWINLGGGHLLTDDKYDSVYFLQQMAQFKAKHPHLKIYIEPGAAYPWSSAKLFSRITDLLVNEGVSTAILDVSFRAHLSDFLVGNASQTLSLDVENMEYVTPSEFDASALEDRLKTYRFGGTSCASCDFKQYYRSDCPLKVGDVVVFQNMGHYCDVTFSLFNGVRPPSIYYLKQDGEFEKIKEYTYNSFRALIGVESGSQGG